MTPAQVLLDGLDRVRETSVAVLDGLTEEHLTHRPGPAANPIGWLLWHAARVQDDHVADVAHTVQVWTDQNFANRFDLPYPLTGLASIGFGHSSDDVAAFESPASLIAEYVEAVHSRTARYLDGVEAEDLDRVVDQNWDPPVTLGVRLVSVVNDGTQHAGQAAYIRGLLGVID